MKPIKSFMGLAIGFGMSVPLGAIAAEPGWGPWQPLVPDAELPFSAGFSNMELGGYLDYSAICDQAATAAEAEQSQEYRLDNLVNAIGTGRVEYRCLVNGEVVAHHLSTAVLLNQPYATCLIVQSDVGTGLNVRQEPTTTSPIVGFLRNGRHMTIEASPVYLSTDVMGRTWLYLPFQGDYAWTSVVAKPGGHINYRLCE